MKKLTKKDFEKELEKSFDNKLVADSIIKEFESLLGYEFRRIQKSETNRYEFKKKRPAMQLCTFVYDSDVLEIVKKEFEPRGFVVEGTAATGVKIEMII